MFSHVKIYVALITHDHATLDLLGNYMPITNTFQAMQDMWKLSCTYTSHYPFLWQLMLHVHKQIDKIDKLIQSWQIWFDKSLPSSGTNGLQFHVFFVTFLVFSIESILIQLFTVETMDIQLYPYWEKVSNCRKWSWIVHNIVWCWLWISHEDLILASLWSFKGNILSKCMHIAHLSHIQHLHALLSMIQTIPSSV